MYFRGCRLVSGGCCSMGFVLGGTLTAMLVVHVMNNLQLKHEKPQFSETREKPQISESTRKPQISESTEKPQISESTEKPQISESTEKPQISESTEKPQFSESTEKTQIYSESTEKTQISESTKKTQISESTEEIQTLEISKPLKQKISLDWSKALKSYSYKNMRNLTYTVRHKIPIKQKKAKRPCLVVVKSQLWFSVYGTIRVYSRKGKFMKSLIVSKEFELYSGIETGFGDICFATGNPGVVVLDSNGKFRYKIHKKRVYDVAYDKGILYGIEDRRKKGKKLVRFKYNGNKWVEIQTTSLQEHHNKSPRKHDEIKVRKNTIYALINKSLWLINIQNVSSNIRPFNLPRGSAIDAMNLLGVDHEGVSLLLDMKHRVLRQCTEDGEWSIMSRLSETSMPGTPMTAVVDPNDNGIWIVYRDNKSSGSYKYILYNIIPQE